MKIEDLYINGDLDKIPQFTKIAGISFNDRQEVISKLSIDDELHLIRDYKNKYDKNAIGVYFKYRPLGYLPKYIAEKLAPEMDAGILWKAIVRSITGQDKDTQGVNIELICETK